MLEFVNENSTEKEFNISRVFTDGMQKDAEVTKDTLSGQIDSFLEEVGLDFVRSLSPDYENGSRLDELIDRLRDDLSECLEEGCSVAEFLRSSAQERAVRLLSIHKCKGLEFEKVIVLGVEKEMFWGKPDDERCAFFVGISRAKAELVLTHCHNRIKPDWFNRRWDASRSPQTEFLGYADGLTS
ncbi:MAG: ATP-binding domain-containing protein [Planctomycetes bacterium]|nr:ATP-binding domain-containing protein [Planctomycetota bacterium]